MEDRNINQYEDEISLVDIFKFFLKYKNLILSITIVSFLGGVFFYYINKKKKLYVTESAISIVWPKLEILLESKMFIKDIGEILFQQFENRKSTIKELVFSDTILTPIIKKAEEQGLIKKNTLSYLDFIKKTSNMIGITSSGEIIKFRVTMSKPELSKLFAEEMTKNTVERIKEIVLQSEDLSSKLLKENFSIKVAYVGEPKEVRKEDSKKFLIIGLFLGLFLGIFLSLIKEGYEKVKNQV